jgi:tetratricopeptide (TPR) repeat protein
MLSPSPLVRWLIVPLVVQFVLMGARGSAVTIREARDFLRQGEYARCAEVAGEEIERGMWLEEWRHLRAKAQLALGDYAGALKTIEEGLELYGDSIEMRLLAAEVYRHNDLPRVAQLQLDAIGGMVRHDPRRYTSTADRIALGRYFLGKGTDARQVLELFYDPVLKAEPDYIEAHLAAAELALEKFDNALAAQILNAAPERVRQDPRYYYLLARAYADSDGAKFGEAIEGALALNPRHAESLLLKVERLVDGEQYDAARQVIDEIREFNPRHPLAWAYSAVIAHLTGDLQGEIDARQKALEPWATNPEVDYTIGRKLSDKYRFAEGAAYQRKVLAQSSDYLPARMQLAQDLLRLGREEEGWQLVHDVFATDGYNVVAHNLVTLHDSFGKYKLVSSESFRVRMEEREARIYGAQVLELLERAKRELCPKYDVQLDEPVIVEIFPHQKDFAVRTFGIPGADGFLGVCFGNVITANSPAALGQNQANWQAVLWHEFCHVVTLKKSKNRMPRWLSEGISVYEERLENPSWGQSMNPTYRRMVLAGEAAPVSELSSAFLSPKSAVHLQFAYYESAVVVEYLVEKHGMEVIKKLLDDLGRGVPINEALVAHVGPLGQLDGEFAEYFRSKAGSMAPELKFDRIDLEPGATSDELAAWLEQHPDNFAGLVRLAQTLVAEKKFSEALKPAERLRELFPDYAEAGNAYELLAAAYRGLKEEDKEREALEEWARRSSDALDAYFRLMEIGEKSGDWELVAENSRRMLAVNPLTPAPHRYLAMAAEKLDSREDAISASRAMLEFDTTDPVAAHFRLAKLLEAEGNRDEARRHTLMALEDAPRYLEALQFLRQLNEPASESANESVGQPEPAPSDDEGAKETPPAEDPSADTPRKEQDE